MMMVMMTTMITETHHDEKNFSHLNRPLHPLSVSGQRYVAWEVLE
jgi:hypothetical protein